MRPPRRSRPLSGEEARLWAEIARLVTPLRGRVRPVVAAPAAKPPVAPARPMAEAPAGPPPPKAPPKTPGKRGSRAMPVLTPTAMPYQAPPAAPSGPPSGLERRARLALRRGSLRVEARIDLHGLYQAEAHAALGGFLMRARAAGHAHVLVVTGKGGPSVDDPFSERGVLRRSVPHWLRSPELRGIVLGFEEAARHHGGAGALYVRLRRR
ncbi:Smr/MutS family protein [Methylobacterium planeticum]|uniref:DNA mismatch repair protein MutS n=1 Tax=Methylobacterium planeticum TaxID=2615211 RepID=A0A6N6MXJ7_9HYPH|nr:Smr/MutS family protein [Methylobacterium planeticum]KAB1075639.1 DNA mismatch repair protein MutS [Methylobacterium planeticum]